ncbi:MAG: efflux transporter outer membrane subunit [Rhodocyclaceae bacterium]|nr:efflux transporter outer membrane subunit [Rhodocyclaceae bacterium]MCA3081614.1 efflux transporter outer membrane subunit [Rhodocyclaceae bacterium]
MTNPSGKKMGPRSLVFAMSAAALAVISACSVGPNYRHPEMSLPEVISVPSAVNTLPVMTQPWWLHYKDDGLNALMGEALQHNLDLQVAAARIAESQAQLGLAVSDQFPSAYVTAGRNRNRNSAASSNTGPGQPLESTTNRVALNISFDLDFWGKYRRASEAARAELLSVESNRDALRLSLTAQVAQSYFALQAFDAQLAATERAITRGEEALNMQKVRLNAGVISAFEYQQREAELDGARVQLPNLRANRDKQQRALAILLGRTPKEVLAGVVKRTSAEQPSSELVLPAGIPSEVLLRRPDLVEAEQKLVATNARIGVARASYFPSLSLTGLLGSESSSLGDLFTGPARIWNFAGNLTQPLWGASRVDSMVAAANARNVQALAQYQLAITNAFKETQDAIQAQQAAREVFDLETRRVGTLDQSWKLAKLRYQQGIASQLEVIDAERNLLAAEQNRIEAARALRAAVADLFKAMGAPVAVTRVGDIKRA